MINPDMRPMTPDNRSVFSNTLYRSFNEWYKKHGWPGDYFRCAPEEAGIFFDVYNDLTPGCSFAFFDPGSGDLMGSCFYHPREHHVSLGIMSVNPDYFGRGIGRGLVNQIIDYTEREGFRSLRLVGSAMNLDSFSLYNRSGFVPRVAFNDMVISVPDSGLNIKTSGLDRVRQATADDVPAMSKLEMEISGISRVGDYHYCIENTREIFHVSVLESIDDGGLDGFLISLKHPALNMIGPGVMRSEADTLALLANELDRFKGMIPLFLIPMGKKEIVEQVYEWGGRNVETHLFQVRGEYKPFNGVVMPSFLPETG